MAVSVPHVPVLALASIARTAFTAFPATKKRPGFPRSPAGYAFRLCFNYCVSLSIATATAATIAAAARHFNLLGDHVADLHFDLLRLLVRHADGIGHGLLLRLAL